MLKIKITVIKKVIHEDLILKYENHLDNPCSLNVGDSWIIDDINHKPDDFCMSAWMSVYPFLLTLASNGENIFDDWMKDKKTAIVSCNDGCRPVSFLLEVIE